MRPAERKRRDDYQRFKAACEKRGGNVLVELAKWAGVDDAEVQRRIVAGADADVVGELLDSIGAQERKVHGLGRTDQRLQQLDYAQRVLDALWKAWKALPPVGDGSQPEGGRDK